MSENVTRKICKECKVEKHVSDFHKRERNVGGLAHKCRLCVNTAQNNKNRSVAVRRWADLKW